MWWLALVAAYFVLRPKPAVHTLVGRWASARQIPPAVLITWIKRESGGNINSYNPEPSALTPEKWVGKIANNPGTWGSNPDFSKAKEVYRKLVAGASQASVASSDYASSLWKFGSFGLMQVSRITASGSGGYPYSAPNEDLFDPDTNLQVGTQVIAKLRSTLYGGRKNLSDTEWSRIRAAYVGGPGILTQRPAAADEIASDFLETLAQVKQSQTTLAGLPLFLLPGV